MSKQYITASKIAQFLYCPFAFELDAAGYEPIEPYLPAVASGVALHTAFRYMWFGNSPEEAVEAAVAVTDITILRRAKAIPQWLLEADDVEVRVEKEIPNTDIIVTGYIDAIVGDMIVDIKGVTKMKNELPPTYQIQAQIYMYASGKPKASFLMLGPKGDVAEFRIERMPHEAVAEMLEYFVRSMEQTYKPPTGLTNFACGKCAYQYACPFYKLLKQTQNPE
jgi:CRISPR/Cas system-associated exonuclease Cas4 (RecB family)